MAVKYLTIPPERRAWRINDFCDSFSISRSEFYCQVNDAKLAIVKVGKRTLIPVPEAERWFAGYAEETRQRQEAKRGKAGVVH